MLTPKQNGMTNHCLGNTAMMRNIPAKQQNRLYTENSTRRRKLKERLEIVRAKKEGKQVLINNVTKFESENPFRLIIEGNKRNTLSQ